jgi:hypothetical protein
MKKVSRQMTRTRENNKKGEKSYFDVCASSSLPGDENPARVFFVIKLLFVIVDARDQKAGALIT